MPRRRPRKVIVGLPDCTLDGPCVFAERLTRGLADAGCDARILLTEVDTACVRQRRTPAAMPSDVLFDKLQAGFQDSWGTRWNALIRYLEEQAPCTYLMLHDWRNNVVASRVSDRVHLIGLVQADTELDYDQAGRLGIYWNAVVAVSDVLHFNVAYRFPHLASRLVTVRNAVPKPAEMPVKSRNGPLRIAYAGELRAPQKRLGDLVKIAFGLETAQTPFELTVIGDGPARPGLEELARPLVDSGRMRFTGIMKNEHVLDELAHQDAFLLTSQFEGLSISLLEAMSRGCVPVVTDLPTQALVVRDRINGYLVPLGNVTGFVDRLSAIATDARHRDRMATAAFQTIVDGPYGVEAMLSAYLALFDRIDEMQQRGGFVRPRGAVLAPPYAVGRTPIFPVPTAKFDLETVYEQPLWPNTAAGEASNGEPRTRGRTQTTVDAPALSDHKLIVSVASGGHISGADLFSIRLIRYFKQHGLDAKALSTEAPHHDLRLELPTDVPVEIPPVPPYPSWAVRWKAMTEYLERQAPCVYLPNYDFEHACIAPRLSERVKVVTIAHSDDPTYYDQVVRIGGASDAVVGVSPAIVQHIAELAPAVLPRLHTIPYGVELPPAPPDKEVRAGAPLRITYAGRLVSYQKRVLDLIGIAQALERRGVPFDMTIIGDGPERQRLHDVGRELLLRRRLRFLGALPNPHVLEVLRESDVLVMPSAFEGLSVSVLEAMAHGIVPIVSDIRSGVPDLIRPEENGLIAPIGDVERFAEHLTFLYQHPQQRQRMARSAYRTVADQGYGLGDMGRRYLSLFEDIVSQPFDHPQGPIVPPEHLRSELRWRAQVRYRIRKPLRPIRQALRVRGQQA